MRTRGPRADCCIAGVLAWQRRRVDRGNSDLRSLIDRARKQGRAGHWGSGGTTQSYVHVEDLAELFCLAAELAPHGTILHGVTADVTQRELARAINRMIGTDGLPQGVHLGLYLVMTVFALLALRVVLQAALLREEHDRGSGAPLLCPNCGQVVPDTAFCSNCGFAANTSSRSSRRARRLIDNRDFIRGQWPPGTIAGG
jgi:hypothetical protein